jgi:hypothetical protein
LEKKPDRPEARDGNSQVSSKMNKQPGCLEKARFFV